MEFEKYLFSVSINYNKIIKYSDGDKIILVHKYRGEFRNQRVFGSEEEYENAIDSVVDDNDAVYDRANALNSVLKAFFNTDLS